MHRSSMALMQNDLLAKPIISSWMCTLHGNFGWKQAAKQYGMEKN